MDQVTLLFVEERDKRQTFDGVEEAVFLCSVEVFRSMSSFSTSICLE